MDFTSFAGIKIIKMSHILHRILKHIPHPVVLLFIMLVTCAILSHVLPSGSFDRREINGALAVIPGTFKYVSDVNLSILDMLLCLPQGFKMASDIIFIILVSGIMFGCFDKTSTFESIIHYALNRKSATSSPFLVILILTFLFGLFGVFVGYENNIGIVPLALIITTALQGNKLLAAGISVGAITVGFGLSPFNPYTVGVGHKIAELPLFSGYEVRMLICFIGLCLLGLYNYHYYIRTFSKEVEGPSTTSIHFIPIGVVTPTYKQWVYFGLFILSFLGILKGVFSYGWFINQISCVFIALSIIIMLFERWDSHTIGPLVFDTLKKVIPGAFMVGLAAAIKVALDTSMISDTITASLTEAISGLPSLVSVGLMAVIQTGFNFMIPSGSGQALATLPILLPYGQSVGISAQTTVLAFQIGDGVSNLINPALGGLIGMLAVLDVKFDEWLVFILPIFSVIWIVCMLLLFMVYLGGY